MSATGRLLRIEFQVDDSVESEASVAAANSTGETVEPLASVELEFLQGSSAAAAAAAITMDDSKTESEKPADISEDHQGQAEPGIVDSAVESNSDERQQQQKADIEEDDDDEVQSDETSPVIKIDSNAKTEKEEEVSAEDSAADQTLESGDAGTQKDLCVAAVKREEEEENCETRGDSVTVMKEEKREDDGDNKDDNDDDMGKQAQGDEPAGHEAASKKEEPPAAAVVAKPKPRDTSDDAASDPHRQPASRGFRLLGIEFAPLNTPMRRRLQTLAVAQWLLTITVLPVLCVMLMFLLLFTPLAPLVLGYAAWLFIFDRGTSQRGGRRWERVRRWSLWRHYRDYFPIRLVKSAELDPKHNYLIGYHPHGIISCGAFCNFGTEATGFSAKFPGIRPHLLTLRINFFWPLLRAYYLSTGVCDVSRPSIKYILGREGGGNAAIIVVGGAQEALDARPGNYRLTLLHRKGFARMALQTGAHLVPCFSFGENDLFRQAANPPGSRVRAFQQLFKGKMGSSPPLFYGRGVFNYNFGLLPFRHEVSTVVGAPIPVVKCPEPTAEQVDVLHKEYMLRLSDLFDQYKVGYGVPDEVKLEFV